MASILDTSHSFRAPRKSRARIGVSNYLRCGLLRRAHILLLVLEIPWTIDTTARTRVHRV